MTRSRLIRMPLCVALLVSLSGATRYDAVSVAARWALDFYKMNISPLQGRAVCSFNPTCSQFSKQAIDRYGVLTGVLMTADRLERCNPYAPSYLGSYYSGATAGRIDDPIENHAPSPQPLPPSPLPPPLSANSDLQSAICSLQSAIGLPPQLAFADYLFFQGDYGRAIGEYQRLAFEDTDPNARQYARFMIAESHLRERDFNAANAAFRKAMSLEYYQLGQLGLARSLLGLNRHHAARHYAASVSDTALSKSARIVQAWSYCRQYDFRSGAALMREFPEDTMLSGLSNLDGRSLSARSRFVSTALSSVIPGLGQAYSGKLGDGVYSLLVVAAFGTVSYYYYRNPDQDPGRIKFGIAAGLGALFHLGNVYGANIAARDYNALQRKNYLSRIESALNRVDLQPDYRRILVR